MMELLIDAERALGLGNLDRAEQLFRQVADNDPRNAIAIVGLARVAVDRDDPLDAYLQARRALAIDPENPAASHLVMRMTEVLAGRGEAVPGVAADEVAAADRAEAAPESAPEPPSDSAPPAASASPAGYRPPGGKAARSRPGLLGRLLGRRRR